MSSQYDASVQTSVIYNSQKLIPAPFVSIEKVTERTPDTAKRLSYWKITVKGKLVADNGSPDYTGATWTGSGYNNDPPANTATPQLRMENFVNKMGALTNMFDIDGQWFEIMPPGGAAAIKAQVTVNPIKFEESLWYNWIGYTIELEADCIYFGNIASTCSADSAANAALETWTVEPVEAFRPTYKLTHNVSAQARRSYNSDGSIAAEGWQTAQTIVEGVLGYSATQVSSVFGLSGFTNYNYELRQIQDEPAGKYTADESWLLCFNNYIEERTYDITYNIDTGYTTGKMTGTITGLRVGTDVTTQYANALAYANTVTQTTAYNQLTNEITVSINPTMMNSVITRNKITGVITYSYEFNNRPDTGGYLTAMTTVDKDNAVEVIAEIPVVANPFGPVLQDIGSITQQSVTVRFEGSIPSLYGQPLPTVPTFDTFGVFTQYIGTPPTVYIKSDRESFVQQLGKYSRTTTFIYQYI